MATKLLRRLDELADLVGTKRLYRHDDKVWFLVKVDDVGFNGCNVKCRVSMVGGIGSFDCCASELYTKEGAEAFEDAKERQDDYDRESRQFRYSSGNARSRLRALKELMSVFATPEEVTELEFLGEGPALSKLIPGMIDEWGRKLLKRKYKLESEPDDEDE